MHGVGFPRRLLAQGEEIVLDLRPHWIALVGPLFLTLLIVAALVAAVVYIPNSWPSWVPWAALAAAVLLFLFFAAPAMVAWATSMFVVTTDRIVHRQGWIAKRSMEIPLENINDVRFNQSIFERMIGAGDLIIESAGTHGQEVFGDIRRPEHVQKVIYEETEKNQQRMSGGHGSAMGGGPVSIADELAKLDRLRADGVISEQEFQQQKARLLGR